VRAERNANEKNRTLIVNRFIEEKGSAILEFLIFGLAANLALLTFSVEIIQSQKNQLAADSIARHASRDFSLNLSEISAQQVASEVATGFSLQPNQWQIAAECEPADCMAADALVKIQVSVENSRATAQMPVLSDSAVNE
jgi:hypothetical protein